MKSRIYTLLLLILVFTVSCSEEYDDTELRNEKYDDTELRNDITDLENRVQELEELCKEMNVNILSLKTLVNALHTNDYIKNVNLIRENEKKICYEINFLKNPSAKIYHGKDGSAPQIGVKSDLDGIYYWRLGEEWLLDDSGNKIKVQDEDRQDGIVPLLKIEDGYWHISYDNGSSWTQLDKVTAPIGNSIFKNINTENEVSVTFELMDGTILCLPKCRKMDILFENAKDVILVPGKVQEIPYKLIGTSNDVIVEALGTNGIEVKVNAASSIEGTLSVVADKIIGSYSKVVVFLNDNGITAFRVLTFEEGVINISSEFYEISYTGGVITIPVETNLDYTCTIEESAKDWITSIPNARSVHTDNLQFTITKNSGGIRTATILFEDTEKRLKRNITILQNSESTSTDGFSEINGTEATIYLDKAENYQAVVKAIKELDARGVTKYVVKGSYEKLGFNQSNYENPFKQAPNVEVIDFTEVTGWTEIANALFVALEDWYIPKYYQHLQKIIFPKEITSIGDSAFYGCSSLSSLEFPNVTTIEGSAFHGCTSLSSLEFPNVTMIESSAFYGCTSLSSLKLPKVTTIRGAAFNGCSSLFSLELPNVTKIGSLAFKGCSKLSKLLLTSPSDIQVESGWLYSSQSQLIQLYLNINKQFQVSDVNLWKELEWESIDYVK